MKVIALLMVMLFVPACVTTAQIKRCVKCLKKYQDLDRFSDDEKYNICEKGLRDQLFGFETDDQRNRDSILKKYTCY